MWEENDLSLCRLLQTCFCLGEKKALCTFKFLMDFLSHNFPLEPLGHCISCHMSLALDSLDLFHQLQETFNTSGIGFSHQLLWASVHNDYQFLPLAAMLFVDPSESLSDYSSLSQYIIKLTLLASINPVTKKKSQLALPHFFLTPCSCPSLRWCCKRNWSDWKLPWKKK